MNSDDSHPPESPGVEPSDSHDGVKLSRRTVCSLGAGLSVMALLGFPGVRVGAAERYDIRYVLTDQRKSGHSRNRAIGPSGFLDDSVT